MSSRQSGCPCPPTRGSNTGILHEIERDPSNTLREVLASVWPETRQVFRASFSSTGAKGNARGRERRNQWAHPEVGDVLAERGLLSFNCLHRGGYKSVARHQISDSWGEAGMDADRTKEILR